MIPALALTAALWLGILTSISPCPLASNIAAISFIGRKVGSMRQVLLSGLLYTIGRTIAYVALGTVILAGLMAFASGSVARVFNRLTQVERWVRRITGVVFVLVGVYYCLMYIYGLGG